MIDTWFIGVAKDLAAAFVDTLLRHLVLKCAITLRALICGFQSLSGYTIRQVCGLRDMSSLLRAVKYTADNSILSLTIVTLTSHLDEKKVIDSQSLQPTTLKALVCINIVLVAMMCVLGVKVSW